MHIVKRLQIMIDELSKRADESDLGNLLATSRACLYDADLARQLRDVVGLLKKELSQRQHVPFANQ